MSTTNVLEGCEDIQYLSSREKRVSHLLFKWTIKNFFTVTSGYKKCITSPTFSSKTVPTSWFVRHSPAFDPSNNARVQFYLCRLEFDAGPQIAIVTFRIGVKMHYVTTWFPEMRSVLFRPGYDSNIEINVTDYYKTDFELNQDMLTVLCEMYVLPSQMERSATKCSNVWRNSQLNLSLELLNCLAKSTRWDVAIQVKDLKFHVHKAIISARSPVLAVLFQNSSPCIHLSEEDYDHIYCLLTYIYTGNLFFTLLDRDLCIGFFECAQRYRVSGLQQLLTPMEISAHTSVTDENVEFTWRFDKFSSLIAENELCVTAISFHDQSKIIPQCTLTIYSNDSASDNLGIYVKPREQLYALYLKIVISILDDNKQENFKRVSERTDVLFDEHGFSDYIEKNQLLGNQVLLQNDQLTIKCEIELSISVESLDETKIFPSQSYDEHFECLTRDYDKLLVGENFSDVTVLIGEEIFRLHKVILSVRCPVLDSRLKQEDTDCVIGITDLTPKVFSEMVAYMYTGKFSKTTPDFVISLYEAAETYRMKSLLSTCSELLRSHFDIKSICAVITLAHKYEDEDLMTDCLKYVSCNQNEVLSSDDWKNLMDSQSDLSAQMRQWVANLQLLNKN